MTLIERLPQQEGPDAVFDAFVTWCVEWGAVVGHISG